MSVHIKDDVVFVGVELYCAMASFVALVCELMDLLVLLHDTLGR